jgi:hypothetical protein
MSVYGRRMAAHGARAEQEARASARTTAGLSYNVAGGAKVLVGGEVGGLGSQNFTTWSVCGRAGLPF